MFRNVPGSPNPLKSGQLRDGDVSKFAALRYHIIDGKIIEIPQFTFEQRKALQDSAGKLVPTAMMVKFFREASSISTFLGTKSDIEIAAAMPGEATGTLAVS